MDLNKKLKFTIVIPTRNRSEILLKSLTNIARLNFSKSNFEVIIVDNNSTDDTKKIVYQFISKNKKIRSNYVFESRIGPSFARNTGIKKAHNPLIVCIDDDILIDKDLLSKFSTLIKKHPDAAVIGGRTFAISENDKKLKKLLKILLEEDSWVFSQVNRNENSVKILNYPDSFLMSACILINLNQVTGKVFDQKFGREYDSYYVGAEDIELCLRLLLKNKKIIYDPSIVASHLVGKEKLSIKYIRNRFFRAGIEHRLLDNKFKETGRRLYKFNSRFFCSLLLKFIIKPNMKNYVKLTRETLFLLGYYFPLAKD